MPIQKTKDGKWKYGKEGKEYPTKKDAIKQGLAILYSQAKKEGKNKPDKEDVEKHLRSAKGVEKKAADEKKYEKRNKYFQDEDTYRGYGFDSPLAKFRDPDAPLGKYEPLMPRANDDLGVVSELIRSQNAYKEHIKKLHSRKLLDESRKNYYKEQTGILEDWKEEVDADSNPLSWDALKLRGPSYLGSVLAGALVGRLIAGRRYKWWGYGLGAAAGGVLNYLRRKSYYGTLA